MSTRGYAFRLNFCFFAMLDLAGSAVMGKPPNVWSVACDLMLAGIACAKFPNDDDPFGWR
ncbi:MAG: hypothetical protein EPN91_07240 [Salinibacterium sp.]|nr:MAG: hypothetical protein EPN91_07240 [Salinibacterium sp.]